MAQRKTLTQRQIDVLRWIADGCPDEVMVGEKNSERITAGALRNRGLVTTKGRGPTWSAAITKEGSEYLTRVDGPNPPVPRAPDGRKSAGLIDEITAAGGCLRVPVRNYLSPRGTPDYERRVANAEQRGAVPPGKRLVVTPSRGELCIELLDAPHGTPLEARPVPIPPRIGRYHPVVAEFRSLEDAHKISRAAFRRACQILQALVGECENRGHGVAILTNDHASHDGRRHVGDELIVTVAGIDITLNLIEEGVSAPRTPVRRGGWYGSTRDPEPPPRSYEHEKGATGRLRITILDPYTPSHRRSTWADGKKQVLEDILPLVLMETETRSAEQREKIRLEKEAAERERRAWEAAMELARVRYAENYRADVLIEQVDNWRKAAEIRGYCEAVEYAHPEDVDAAEWISWARAYADRIDPVQMVPTLPEPPADVAPEDLKPFLDGWSPYGPDTHRRRWR